MRIRRRSFIALAALPIRAWAADESPAVVDAWSRAAAQGGTGVLYLTLRGGSRPDRLLRVEADASDRAELHESTREEGIVRMRPVTSIALPAAATVQLAPGGYHVMLINLKHALKRGDKIAVTLDFEQAGKVGTIARVREAGVPSTMTMKPAEMDE